MPAELNTRFALRTDLIMDDNAYAITSGADGELYVCKAKFRITETEGAAPYLDASCDVITVMGDRLYYNRERAGNSTTCCLWETQQR